MNIYGSLQADTSAFDWSSAPNVEIAASTSVNIKLLATSTNAFTNYLDFGQVVDFIDNAQTSNYPQTGTYNLNGDLNLNSSGDAVSIRGGTFNAGNSNLTANNFILFAGGAAVAVNMGSGTWNVGGGVTTAWNCNANVTLNAQTSTLLMKDTGQSALTFAGGTHAYNIVTYSGGGSGKAMTITGSNSFAQFNVTGLDKTVKFTATTTQTIAALSCSGSASHPNILQGATSALWYLVLNGTASADYCTVTYSSASGSATPVLDFHGTNGGNNSGWQFVPTTARGAVFFFKLV
jgi:hypothetical protein